MKKAFFIAIVLLALPAIALDARIGYTQTAPDASTLVAPTPVPSVSPTPVTALLLASTPSQQWTPGPLSVSIGAVVSFMLAPCGTPYPATLTVLVNGRALSFSGGGALSFTANVAGIWNVQLATPGFTSNTVTITAQ